MIAVDLFSGLAGFSLAAHANGIRTVCFVEKDERCRAFLSRAWPGVEIFDDIKTFPAERFRGADFVMGGPPCQPVSCAGKQLGRADDRFLWEETISAIERIQPRWALLENPSGIFVHLDGILAALESAGYETGTVGIPACAVGAPHQRMRYWIVGRRMAHTGSAREDARSAQLWTWDGAAGESVADDRLLAHRCQARREERIVRRGVSSGAGRADSREDARVGGEECADGGVADAACHAGRERERASGKMAETSYEEIAGRNQPASPAANRIAGNWSRHVWLPCADGKFRRAPDDSFGLVDGLHRSVLGALGNSIVPQVAEQIMRAMIAADEAES